MKRHLVRVHLESGIFIDAVINAMDESTVEDVLENASQQKNLIENNILHKNNYTYIEYISLIAGEPTKWIGDDSEEE